MSDVHWQRPLPLFPLRAVLFPGGLLPLKVFEARYIDLVTQCLREDRAFGVLCLLQGTEAGRSEHAIQMETVGVLATVSSLDAEQAGILRVNCLGGQRFTCVDSPVQQDNGLWQCQAQPVLDDEPVVPAPALFATVQALSGVITKMRAQGHALVTEPWRLDDAAWVANRWCEILPIALSAKQKLMALPDAQARLTLVDSFLRDKGVVP